MVSNLSFVLVALFIGNIACEVVELKPCLVASGAEPECTIHEVSITPCKESPHACVIKKGKSATVSFDFTPNFAATKLQTMVYWENGILDLPFGGMDSEACKFTNCPIEVGKRQTFEYNLAISKMLPSGLFPIKWIVWNEDNPDQRCCITSSIRLKAK